MDSDSQDSTRARRARRKAEQVELYISNQSNQAAPEPNPRPYIDLPVNSQEAPRAKPYIDASGRPGDNAAPNQILEYLEAVKSRKLLIVFTAFAGAVYGVITLIPESPIYQASTMLEIQELNESFMNRNQVDPQAGNYSPNQLNMTTQLRIIESETMRNTVYGTVQREITPVVKPQVGIMAKLRNRYGSAATQDPLAFTREALMTATVTLRAQQVPGTRLIEIIADSTSPEIAATFVNAAAEEYIQQSGQQRSGSTQKTVQSLESQVEDTRVKLEQAENKLQSFQRSSGVFAGEQETLANSRLKNIQTNLANIRADVIAKQTRYETVKATPPDALPELLADPTLRSQVSKLSDLKRQRVQLLTTLMPANPKVVKLDEEIDYLEKEYAKERDNAVVRVKNDFEAAQRQERSLLSAYNGQTGAVNSQADKNVEYMALKRDVAILSGQLSSFLLQANQAGSAASITMNNVKVIDTAHPASYPYKPNSFQRVAANLMIGIGLGCLIAVARAKYLKNKADRKFAAPGHSSALLQVPELGVIPSASFRTAKRNRWGLPWKREMRLLQNGKSAETEGNGDLELIGPHDMPSLLADSFRLMVVSITLMNKDSNSNAFLVTSPGPAEGKTTLISNLAVVMAETGRRVLLIDMDLRKPRLHHLFGVDHTRGLTDLIRGDLPMDFAAVQEFIQPTKIPGVSILPCGGMLDIKSITQLFYSPKIAAFMKLVRKMADIVLIDAPPMMQFSEARLMASMADRVILVLRSGSTDRETALVCQQRLAEDGANLLGTILNDWNPSASHTDYSGYYSYYQQQVEGK